MGFALGPEGKSRKGCTGRWMDARAMLQIPTAPRSEEFISPSAAFTLFLLYTYRTALPCITQPRYELFGKRRLKQGREARYREKSGNPDVA